MAWPHETIRSFFLKPSALQSMHTPSYVLPGRSPLFVIKDNGAVSTPAWQPVMAFYWLWADILNQIFPWRIKFTSRLHAFPNSKLFQASNGTIGIQDFSRLSRRCIGPGCHHNILHQIISHYSNTPLNHIPPILIFDYSNYDTPV